MKLLFPVFLLVGSILSGFFFSEHSGQTEIREALPEASLQGAEVFGCLINDQPWVAQEVQAHLYTFEHSVCLSVRSGEDLEDRLAFIIQGTALKPGRYVLDDQAKDYIHLQRNESECTFVSDEFYQAVLTIHEHDEHLKRLSGTFEFLAYSQSCSTAIRGTHGRFNVSYSTY
ncbi:MAG: DUF6252 family protein [Cyclobacteriaceae bacterium]